MKIIFETLPVVKISDDMFLTMSSDYGLKCIEGDIGKTGKAAKVGGYLCPYCLLVFSSRTALYRDHISEHKGPVKCDSCMVGMLHKLIYFYLFAYYRESSLMFQSRRVTKRGVYIRAKFVRRVSDTNLVI